MRTGGRPAGIVVVVLLACALGFNLLTLPYTPWFKIAMFCAFPIACLAGIRYGRIDQAARSVGASYC